MSVLPSLVIVAALTSALIAGVFFAFSTFVMRALARLPSHEGLAAMQSINIVVINPLFLTPFLGNALLCVVVFALALFHRPSGTAYLVAGSALYFFGTFLVTVCFNVPLNDAIAPIIPADPDAQRLWCHYLRRWTLWNHLRTLASLASAAALLLAPLSPP